MEKLAAIFRGSPAESKRILIKVIIQLFVAYGTLMDSQEPPVLGEMLSGVQVAMDFH